MPPAGPDLLCNAQTDAAAKESGGAAARRRRLRRFSRKPLLTTKNRTSLEHGALSAPASRKWQPQNGADQAPSEARQQELRLQLAEVEARMGTYSTLRNSETNFRGRHPKFKSMTKPLSARLKPERLELTLKAVLFVVCGAVRLGVRPRRTSLRPPLWAGTDGTSIPAEAQGRALRRWNGSQDSKRNRSHRSSDWRRGFGGVSLRVEPGICPRSMARKKNENA